MDLSIVIVNYNSSALLRDCLESIYASQLKLNFEVIVVDNNSTDKGLPSVQAAFDKPVYMELNHNRGFAAGNNAGISKAKGKAILLLNPDTIVDKNAVYYLYDRLCSSNKIGICGPKIFYGDGCLQTQYLAKSSPSLSLMFFEMFYLGKIFKSSRHMNAYYGSPRTFDYDKEQYVDQVSGACLMIKREVVDVIGPMDEKFFMYFEETDWCYRSLKAGYKTVYVPRAEIVHLEGGSGSINRKKNVDAFYGSELYFFVKHYGSLATVFLYILNLTGFTFRLLLAPIYLIAGKGTGKLRRFFWAWLYHANLIHLPGALSR